MAHKKEYYEKEKRKLEKQIREIKGKNNKVLSEVRELEKAYNKLGRIKRSNANNAALVKTNSSLSKVAGNVKWKGKAKEKFDKYMKSDVSSAANKFYQSIDRMHDEVGRALDRKRGELNTGVGGLDILNKKLNKVMGFIRNLTN